MIEWGIIFEALTVFFVAIIIYPQLLQCNVYIVTLFADCYITFLTSCAVGYSVTFATLLEACSIIWTHTFLVRVIDSDETLGPYSRQCR